MKPILIFASVVFVSVMFLLGLSIAAACPISSTPSLEGAGDSLGLRLENEMFPQSSVPDALHEATIEPGLRVGLLKLGDNRERSLELFPKKDEDQEWTDSCGTTLDWVDSSNRNGRGDVFIRLNKKGKVFQIEVSTNRFHTPEGIATFDHADKVVEAYKNLNAYTLLTPPVPALGDRPLVFWIDKKRGVAFEFAYYPKEHKRYVYKIVVFEPNKTFCPEEETTGSPKWQAIRPYSLEPPIELAPNPE